jgi:hypothetical protein
MKIMARMTKTAALASTLLVISSTTIAAPVPTFEGAEHVRMGDEVALRFDASHAPQKGVLLHLPNGLVLSYGNVLTLGDFYELPGQPVAEGANLGDMRARFTAAFQSLSKPEEVVGDVAKVLAVIQVEQTTLDDGIKQGIKPEDIYKRIADDISRQLNCATGGGCGETWYLEPGRYLTLAMTNNDHFGQYAWITYQVGHQLALELALLAHQTQNHQQIELAYAMNAFASHFLTDRFASGHIRTPRNELFKTVTPNVVGSLLVRYMHHEENAYGLHVHNQRGDHFVAYGDDYYLSDNNADTRTVLQEALQLSADEIFYAYVNGALPQDSKIEALIPVPDEVGNQAKQDIAPLFYWDDQLQLVLRRVTTADVHDRNWTTSWWGWTTYLQLSRERGLPTGAPKV